MTVQEAIMELKGIRPRGGIIPQKRAEAIDVAVWALGKQIQKKPNEEQKDSVEASIPRCPCCYSMFIERYCAKCGQAIDWSVEEC